MAVAQLDPLQYRYDVISGSGGFVTNFAPPFTFWRVLRITLANPTGSGGAAIVAIRRWDDGGSSQISVPEGGCVTLEPGGAYGALLEFVGPMTMQWLVEFVVPMTAVATAT
jgi:hypothetical protein